MKFSKKQQREILKRSNKDGSISAADFKKICVPKIKKVKNITSKEYQNIQSKNLNEYSFKCSILVVDEVSCEVLLFGRHLSTNSILSSHFRNKLRYKTAIKNAFYDAALIYQKEIEKLSIDKAIITPVVYLPRHRDDDNNSLTLKIMRDMLINIGIVRTDDDRKHLRQTEVKEEISKEWKIKLNIEKLH